MLLRNLFIILCLLIFFSCSKEKPLYEPQAKIDPFESYNEGFEAFQNNDFFYANKKFSEAEINFKSVGVNPYLFNILGEHRAIKSYAYLTGRNTSSVGVSTRNEGFFNAFSPFYQLNTK